MGFGSGLILHPACIEIGPPLVGGQIDVSSFDFERKKKIVGGQIVFFFFCFCLKNNRKG